MTAMKAEPRLFTIPETAGRLGCSEMHVYRLITAGALHATDIALPASRKPKTRVREDELTRYINGQTRVVPGAA